MRIMLDSNIYDRIIEAPDFVDLLERAVTRGQMVMLFTHIQEMELSQTVDLDKRAALLSVFNRLAKCGRKISTEGFIPGYAQPGYSRVSDGGPNINLNHIRIGAKHVKDALIAATADTEADILVTG
jgi:hypothetical protein